MDAQVKVGEFIESRQECRSRMEEQKVMARIVLMQRAAVSHSSCASKDDDV